ncbi:MAG: transcriptional regulator NrdR [Candidatus Nanohaloarchaea archaeon]
MQCPYCDHDSTKVVDTREASEKVRRRRECSSCGRRFTTYETAEKLDIKVKKRDGDVEDFDENKIRNGVSKAIEKTSIDEEEVDCIVEDVKKAVRGEKEVPAEEVGEAVKEALKERDEVAYIRFASVYDSFDDVESFRKEVEALKES